MTVTSVPAGPHGGDGREVARALGLDPSSILDLSASLNPFAPDVGPVVAAHLRAGALGTYPDAHDERRATDAMAEAVGVPPARLLLTNGGAEAIALVAAELGRGWVEEPDFSLYRRHLPVLDPAGPRFRSDPRNPTGELAGPEETAAVWDEAFLPLAAGRFTMGRPGIAVGSLTKVLACPGLRVGWVIVPEDDGDGLGVPGLHQRLRARQPRWSVSTLALRALPDLLSAADPVGWTRQVADARTGLVTVLGRHGLVPRPSATNFVLVDDVPSGLRDRLAARGVVIRDGASFGLAGSVRIAVPDPAGLERLDRALAGAA